MLPDWTHIKGQMLAAGSSNRQPRKQFLEPMGLSDPKSTEPSASMSFDEFGGVDSASMPSTSRVAEVRLLFYC